MNTYSYNTFEFLNSNSRNQQPFLSIIVPLYNESENLAECHKRVEAVLDQFDQASEVIYIDDGSTDDSWLVLQNLAEFYQERMQSKQSIRLLRFSRNFGKEAAMTAGLKEAKGRASIILDADLQDPPELIPDMVAKWQSGFDVVDMQRSERHGESEFKKLSASLYYKLINHLSDTTIPENVGDFRLLDQRVVAEINKLDEASRYMKGIMAWPGFKRITVKFERAQRFKGVSKWSYAALLALAWDGIRAFSTKPLRMISCLGILTVLIGATSTVSVVLFSSIFDFGSHGMYLMACFMTFLEGLQLLAVGIVAEYVAQLTVQSQQRPIYIVQDRYDYSAQSSQQGFAKQPQVQMLG